jgi:hypothetical protein
VKQQRLVSVREDNNVEKMMSGHMKQVNLPVPALLLLFLLF